MVLDYLWHQILFNIQNFLNQMILTVLWNLVILQILKELLLFLFVIHFIIFFFIYFFIFFVFVLVLMLVWIGLFSEKHNPIISAFINADYVWPCLLRNESGRFWQFLCQFCGIYSCWLNLKNRLHAFWKYFCQKVWRVGRQDYFNWFLSKIRLLSWAIVLVFIYIVIINWFAL